MEDHIISVCFHLHIRSYILDIPRSYDKFKTSGIDTID